MSVESWRVAWYMAHLGYRVFPLRTGGKQPRARKQEHGTVDAQGRGSFYVATTDPEKIKHWVEVIPEANYGIATGTELTVLDLDRHAVDQDGIGVFDEWCKKFGGCSSSKLIENTFTVRTPSDGLHVYFKYFTAKSRTIVDGIEIQNHGRYVAGPGVAVPKGHYLTNQEAVRPDQLLPAPAWLRQLVNGQFGVQSGVRTSTSKRSIQACLIEDGRVRAGERHDAVFMELVLMFQQDGLTQWDAFLKINELINEHVPQPEDFSEGEIKRNIKNVLGYLGETPEEWLYE